MRTLLAALLLSFVVTGCAAPDRGQTSFMSVYEDNTYVYCRYEAVANAEYPENSHAAETARIRWLESWLRENGLGGKSYDIASRNAVRTYGEDCDIFYEVRVRK